MTIETASGRNKSAGKHAADFRAELKQLFAAYAAKARLSGDVPLANYLRDMENSVVPGCALTISRPPHQEKDKG